MSAQKFIRRDRFRHQIGSAFNAVIHIGSKIGVGPAIEAAFDDVSEKVRWYIVANVVALVYARPEAARFGIECNSDGVAPPADVYLHIPAVTICHPDGRASRDGVH